MVFLIPRVKTSEALILLAAALSVMLFSCSREGELPQQSFTTEFSAPPRRALTLEDYFIIESIGSPEISPNGNYVAYTHSYINEEENRSEREIWIVDAGGTGEARKITDKNMNASGLQWSPEGHLMYSSERALWFLDIERPGNKPFTINGIERS
ncbi:hypothetical protein ACFL4Q_04890, partial [candidate division KSB1 bacterium]